MEEERVETEEPKGLEPNPLYVCIKSCFINSKLLKKGDKIRLSDGDAETWLKSECLVAKKDAPAVEEEIEGPKTLSEIATQEAQKTIDDLNVGQGPDNEAPVASVEEAGAEEFLE